jgi:hypothetical protein
MLFVDNVLRRDHSTTLEHYLAGARASGKSFETIAKALADLIDLDGFSVTYGTIRRWCERLGIKAKAS